MKTIAHRGLWRKKEEQNTLAAFFRALDLGFGVEVDIRDRNQQLVIAHDLPSADSPLLKDLLQYYKTHGYESDIALNVKADGLQLLLKPLLAGFGMTHFFAFDASVPDTLGYHRHGITFYTRESDLEIRPALYEEAAGVWMDELRHSWISTEDIERHVRNHKAICIVSPELHGLPHLPRWEKLLSVSQSDGLALCTDFPEEAQRFF